MNWPAFELARRVFSRAEADARRWLWVRFLGGGWRRPPSTGPRAEEGSQRQILRARSNRASALTPSPTIIAVSTALLPAGSFEDSSEESKRLEAEGEGVSYDFATDQRDPNGLRGFSTLGTSMSSTRVIDDGYMMWQQSDNVAFEQSRNVVLTASNFGDAGGTTTDDPSRT